MSDVHNFLFTVGINSVRTNTNSYTFTVGVGVEQKPTFDLSSAIISSISNRMSSNFDSYYDQFRMGKTLLNLGEDNQQIIVNWQRRTGNDIALKLIEPLYSEFLVGSNIFVSREIQSSILESIRLLPVDVQVSPQLRPSIPNLEISSNRVAGTLSEIVQAIAGITHSGSLVSGSQKTYVSNQILEKFYNKNRVSSDINTDFSNYSNFITFGSAEKRIDVFYKKLEEIQNLVRYAPTNEIALGISGSTYESGSYSTIFGTLIVDASGSASLVPPGNSIWNISSSVSSHINTSNLVSLQIQELIRGFDQYEASLWFDSNIPYSGSDDNIYFQTSSYLSDYTYPKILGLPYHTTSSVSLTWYSSSVGLASSYDENNRNRLQYNLPKFLQEDENSSTFLTFMDVIGHHFDNIRVYIDAMSQIHSRYPKVGEEIGPEMSRKVLESFGVNLPSISSVESLVKYVTGDNTGSVSYKDVADEYYKRYLHALPHLLKTKGTKKSIEGILNIFGINSNLITVRESVTNQFTSIEPKTITTTEQDFYLNLNSGSSIVVPFSSSLRSPKTIQIRFATADRVSQTLLNIGNKYRLDLVLHPSSSTNTYYTNYGRMDLVSGSTTIVSSSYFDLFDEEFTSAQLSYSATGVNFYIRKIENDELSFSQSLQETMMSMSGDWESLSDLYIGVPLPSSSLGYISASLDEFRLWSEVLNEGLFIQFAENPGSYVGPSYTSSLYTLLSRLSFNLPTDVYTSGYVTNTSPYLSKTTTPSLATHVATGFNVGTSPLYQTTRHIRTIIETSYNVGANVQTTDMIRIAPDAPSSGSTSVTLTSTRPLVSMGKKFATSSVGSTRLDISISPQDSVDRDIIRAYGDINIGDYIGLPIDRYKESYSNLSTLRDTFVENLAPTINYNSFIRYFDKFLHLFYETIDDYIPARARITKGIVIRSDILSRNKIVHRTPIQLSGETSRTTENFITSNDKDVIRSQNMTLVISPTASSDIQTDYSTYDASLLLPSYFSTISNDRLITSDREDYLEMTCSVNLTEPITSVVNSGYSSTEFDNYDIVITRPDEFGTSSLYAMSGSLYAYGSLYDPYDFECYTYFNRGSGLYYVDTRRYVPVTQSYMPITPRVFTWANGNSYKLGDVVLQTGITGSDSKQLSQNGKYFVYINRGYSSNPNVKSIVAPQLDPENWTRLHYKPEIYQRASLFAYVNGNTTTVTQMTNISSSYDSIPHGYTRKHFIFTRDDSLGARRRTYLGTMNTSETSFDGRDPYETFDININTIQVSSPEPV